MAGYESPNRLDGDVGRKDEELHRDELLRAPLGRLGEGATAPETPNDDHACRALYRAVDAESDQGDAARTDSRDHGDNSLGRHPYEARPGEELRVPNKPLALGSGESCGGDAHSRGRYSGGDSSIRGARVHGALTV